MEEALQMAATEKVAALEAMAAESNAALREVNEVHSQEMMKTLEECNRSIGEVVQSAKDELGCSQAALAAMRQRAEDAEEKLQESAAAR